MTVTGSDEFERYKIWPIRLRLIRGMDLFSLWGSDVNGAGEDVLLTRRHRILVSLAPSGLQDFVVSGKGHSMTKWSNFKSLRNDAKSGRLSVSNTNPFVYDFPRALDTIDALAGSRLTGPALDNLLNTLNLLWDATEMWPRLEAKKRLTRRTALGRLADALTFRDGSKGASWQTAIPGAQIGKEFLLLIGTVAAHCEVVDSTSTVP